jgi:hypothetical protein
MAPDIVPTARLEAERARWEANNAAADASAASPD